VKTHGDLLADDADAGGYLSTSRSTSGYWLSGESKMSKSRRQRRRPLPSTAVRKEGGIRASATSSPARLPVSQTRAFTYELLRSNATRDLANGLENLLSRTASISRKRPRGPVRSRAAADTRSPSRGGLARTSGSNATARTSGAAIPPGDRGRAQLARRDRRLHQTRSSRGRSRERSGKPPTSGRFSTTGLESVRHPRRCCSPDHAAQVRRILFLPRQRPDRWTAGPVRRSRRVGRAQVGPRPRRRADIPEDRRQTLAEVTAAWKPRRCGECARVVFP